MWLKYENSKEEVWININWLSKKLFDVWRSMNIICDNGQISHALVTAIHELQQLDGHPIQSNTPNQKIHLKN